MTVNKIPDVGLDIPDIGRDYGNMITGVLGVHDTRLDDSVRVRQE